jgi:hypothetical protein
MPWPISATETLGALDRTLKAAVTSCSASIRLTIIIRPNLYDPAPRNDAAGSYASPIWGMCAGRWPHSLLGASIRTPEDKRPPGYN